MPAPQKTSLKDRLTAAVAVAKAGDVAGAATIYRQILAQYPKHTGARKALKNLEKSQSAAEGSIPKDQANRLMSFVNSGQLGDAENLALRLSQNHPREAGLFNIIGFCQTQTGRNDAALASFTQAVEVNPVLVEALSNMGSLLVQLDRPAEALIPLQKAVKTRPDYAEAHHNLGIAHSALQNIEPAEAALPGQFSLHRNTSMRATAVPRSMPRSKNTVKHWPTMMPF